MAVGYTFNSQGLPYQQTSYADTAGTIIVNQTQDEYNGLGQLSGQYQSVSGAVNTSTTPQVQYVYATDGSGNPTDGSRFDGNDLSQRPRADLRLRQQHQPG